MTMDMKILYLFLTLVFSTLAQDEKLAYMRQSSDSSDLWDMDWDTFKKYVVDGPRNYTTVVYFTSTSPELNCPFCPVLKKELEIILGWYRSSVSASERDVFFVVAEYGRNKQVYQNYYSKIQTMPAIVRIPPTTKKNIQFKFQEEDKVPLTSDYSANYIAEYINRIGGTKLKPPLPSYTLHFILGAVVFVLFAINAYRFHQSSTFWLCCVLFVVWFGYTGTFFNLNMSPPFIYVHPVNQQMVIFWPSQQMQTGLEGLIMATLIISIGLSFALLGTWVPTVKKNRRLLFWLFTVLISILGYCFSQIWLIKSPWYMSY